MRLGEDATEMLRIATTHLCPTMSSIRMLEYAVAPGAIIEETRALSAGFWGSIMEGQTILPTPPSRQSPGLRGL